MQPIAASNDFVVKFANVNGSGSASANELFAKCILRMGVPVSPRNIFPSNIQGLPTWYEVRVNERGWLGRRGGVDLMVAMNPQTWDADVKEIEPGGYLFYDSTKPLPKSKFRDDITVIGPDLWANYLDDNRLLVTTFSNQARYQQAYPSNYPEALNEDQIGSNAVGEYDGLSTFTDARYRRCLWMDHTKLSMKALFMGLNLDEMEPEKWAIDNVKIKIFFDAVFDKYYLPVVLQ